MEQLELEALPSPADLQKITQDVEMAEMRAALAKLREEENERRQMRESFMQRDIGPAAISRVMAAMQRAAERGEQEIMVMQFPSEFCSDHGRAINNLERDWPDTLQGVARRGYEIYRAHFQPKGYRLRAQILDYPGGMLGDVGVFLEW